ncbi:hypothetical protein PG990_011044 [Apiospora arundinis]
MSTASSSKAVTARQQDVLRDAVNDFKDGLTDAERRELEKMRAIPDADSIMVFTAELDSTHRERTGPSYGSRLHTVLSSVGVFCGVVGTFVSSHPEIAALVWGSVSLTMVLCANFTSYYDVTSRLFMKLGRLCPLYADYQALYPASQRIRKALVDFHASIVRCCRHVVQTVKRPHRQQLFKSMLVSFDQEFKSDLEEIQRLSESIDREIHFAKAQADSQAQQLQAMERQEASRSRALVDRFTGRTDDGLRRLHEMQLQRDERNARERKQQLLDSLSNRDYLRVYKQSCRKRWQGTASWIFQIPDFQKWLVGETPVLWCSGKIGSGKTITTASVIQHVLRCKGPSEGPVYYFFIQSTGAVPLSPKEILKSILRQRLERTDITEEIEAALRNLDMSSDVEEILNILRQSIPPEGSYIMIDGIDECHQSHRRELLTALSDLASWNNNIRLFLSGRTGIHDEIQVCFKNISHIQLDSEATNHDITRYIEGAIDYNFHIGDLRVRDPNLIGEIKGALAQGAQGMFLWAYLQVKEISSRPFDEDIGRALNNLPKDLNGIFNRALQRIRDGTRFKEAQRVFTWIKAAVRPLTLDQVCEAIAIRATQQSSNPDSLCNNMEMIALWCENLVEIEEESDCVQFVHHSVRTFLLGDATDDMPAVFHLDLDQSNHKVGEICLTYLNFSDFKRALMPPSKQPMPLPIHNLIEIANTTARPGSRRAAIYRRVFRPHAEAFDLRRSIEPEEDTTTMEVTQALAKDYPLLEYAAEHWISHTLLIRASNSRAWKLLDHAVSSKLHFAKLPWNSDSNSRVNALRWAKRHHHFAIIRLLSTDTHVEMMKWAADNDDCPFFHTLFEELSKLKESDQLEDVDFSEIQVYAASLGYMRAFDGTEPYGWVSDHRLDRMAQAMAAAARKGHVDVVKRLLDWGANIDFQIKLKITPIEAAAQSGQLEVVDAMLSHQVNKLSWNSLAEAAGGGHASVVSRLITVGANVHGRNVNTDSPLTRAIMGAHHEVVGILMAAGAHVNIDVSRDRNNPLLIAILEDNLEILGTLLAAGVDDVEFKVPAFFQVSRRAARKEAFRTMLLNHEVKLSMMAVRPRTMLHVAVSEKLEGVVTLLEAGVNGNAVDKTGSTALHIATRKGDLVCIESLLKAGVMTDTVDGTGSSALHIATQNWSLSIVETLLKAGSDANVVDKSGSTALHIVARDQRGTEELSILEALIKAGVRADVVNRDGSTALHIAIRYNKWEVVKRLLEIGADTNVPDEIGSTVLHIAVKYTVEEKNIESLLKAGVKADALDNHGRTALHIAAAGSLPRVVSCLCQSGSNVLNATDRNGDTALHIAARKASEAVVRVVSNCGIDKYATNTSGETALSIAQNGIRTGSNASSREREVLKILEEAGC